MAKIKLPKKSPSIDMTPLVDLFFLLLTFFMLTASFREAEVTQVDSPFSVSEKTAPDNNLITVLISNENKVYLNFDNGMDTSRLIRKIVLNEITKRHDIEISDENLTKFARLGSFGLPVNKIPAWLNSQNADEKEELQKDGIPIDSTDNQFVEWIRYIRTYNPYAEVAIKGDANTDLALVRKVMDMLQDNNVNKFNLITSLHADEVTLEDVK